MQLIKTKRLNNEKYYSTIDTRKTSVFRLLSNICCPSVLTAQNGVSVSNLAINAGAVTFNVSWEKAGMPALWSDTVWVFVDYNNAGVMTRLPLDAGATLTATSAPGVGRVIQYSDNNKGVWVVGNARSAGSFSATVQLLAATTDIVGACAYASNYPPVADTPHPRSFRVPVRRRMHLCCRVRVAVRQPGSRYK
ncbi:MAG: hypothetical protein LBD52_02975 [Prevotellaceae bacterium]|jgi:hypothetical protein|nr:hypothetical protein [Prevotellaceae bacterium]